MRITRAKYALVPFILPLLTLAPLRHLPAPHEAHLAGEAALPATIRRESTPAGR